MFILPTRITKIFYTEQIRIHKFDCYTKALIYTLGICNDTRRRFDSMYDSENRSIVRETIHAVWQTGGLLVKSNLHIVKHAAIAVAIQPGGLPIAVAASAGAQEPMTLCHPFQKQIIIYRAGLQRQQYIISFHGKHYAQVIPELGVYHGVDVNRADCRSIKIIG
jgi:hypothetical protein